MINQDGQIVSEFGYGGVRVVNPKSSDQPRRVLVGC